MCWTSSLHLFSMVQSPLEVKLYMNRLFQMIVLWLFQKSFTMMSVYERINLESHTSLADISS